MQKPTDKAFITLVAYEKQRPHYWVRFAKSVKGKTTLSDKLLQMVLNTILRNNDDIYAFK